jgi:hypothetical protein
MKKELIHDIKMLRNRLSILETCIERSDAEVLENAFIKLFVQLCGTFDNATQ